MVFQYWSHADADACHARNMPGGVDGWKCDRHYERLVSLEYYTFGRDLC